jgi:hypothetical protein
MIVSVILTLLVSGCQRIETLGDTILDIIEELSGIGDAITDMIENITRSIEGMPLRYVNYLGIPCNRSNA